MGSKAICGAALCALALVAAGTATGAPRPDPPPLPPQPPPATPQPPAAPQPAPPPPVVAAAPAGPSAAEFAARRRAAVVARRRAQARRAARAKAQRQRAARVAAQKRAAATRLVSGTAPRHTAGTSETESPLMNAVPLLAVGILGAALCLGAALTPARALPWESASRALHERRQDFALLGALSLAATGVFFLFALVLA